MTCDKPHDPEPYVQSGLAMAQNNWMGPWRFQPRPKYCQDKSCYDQGSHKDTENQEQS